MIKILKEQNIRYYLIGKLILYTYNTPGFRQLGEMCFKGA